MFTGIIRSTAKVKRVEAKGEGLCVAIDAPRGWKLLAGGSVAIDGICSTVVGKRKGAFLVEYMPETLRVTTAADFSPGRIVNLEEPLRIGETLDGHFVQGHVDAVAKVARVSLRGGSHEITITIPKNLRRFLARKGSITVNGVALTVALFSGSTCTLALIPYTLVNTNLGTLKKGDSVNVEVDLIARYLAQFAQT